MIIKATIFTDDHRHDLEVLKNNEGSVIITSIRDKSDYSGKEVEEKKETTTIYLDGGGARQLLLALQKLLF